MGLVRRLLVITLVGDAFRRVRDRGQGFAFHDGSIIGQDARPQNNRSGPVHWGGQVYIRAVPSMKPPRLRRIKPDAEKIKHDVYNLQ